MLPTALLHERSFGPLWMVAATLVPIGVIIGFHQFSLLAKNLPDLKNQFLLSVSLNRSTFLNGLLYLIPVVIFQAMILFLCKYQYIALSGIQVWKYIIVAPIVEEFFFRFLLPKLVSDDQCTEKDYVVFSVIFACLHGFPRFVPIFIFSLYEYFLVEKTGSLSLAIAYRAISNFFCFAFSSAV
ncbi:MAG: CPBP family intramembrane metalloprotease [Chlamydiales bacterium]|nr:CPBP family intramembrane metalloprotease [Chlamydiales bacterium]